MTTSCYTGLKQVQAKCIFNPTQNPRHIKTDISYERYFMVLKDVLTRPVFAYVFCMTIQYGSSYVGSWMSMKTNVISSKTHAKNSMWQHAAWSMRLLTLTEMF